MRSKAVAALAFDPHGARLAASVCPLRDCARTPRQLRLWLVEGGRSLAPAMLGHAVDVAPHPGPPLPLFHAGDRVITISHDGAIAWDLGLDALRTRACRLAGRGLDPVLAQRDRDTWVG